MARLSISMTLAASASAEVDAEVDSEWGSDNEFLRIVCIFDHGPNNKEDRCTVKREMLTSWSLVLKQCLSRVRFDIKWTTMVFINLNNEGRLASFIRLSMVFT